jgi:hypothetical protein
MSKFWMVSLVAALALAGCDDGVSPRDVTPPAAPRGFYTVTGDGQIYLFWLDNTEHDLSGYRIYVSPCADGPGCPYEYVGATSGTSFTVSALPNGVTRYFAIAAVDANGNESDLSYETVFDTPRPEGFDQPLANYVASVPGSGYDFSSFTVRNYDDAATDVFYGNNGSVAMMFVPDFDTQIQDAGYATNLDAVDFAPSSGWSPTGSVELIVGHCYIVWTRDDHYAKFRVTQLGENQVRFDWAYQVDRSNPELAVIHVDQEGAATNGAGTSHGSGGRRPIAWAR